MIFDRRRFIGTVAAGAIVLAVPACAIHTGAKTAMYGLIGKMKAVPGQRDALISILLEGVSDMPGCLSYIVAQDPTDADTVWVTEVWDSQTSHKESLSLPFVKETIARGIPLIAAFDQQIETVPVGGHGIRAAA